MKMRTANEIGISAQHIKLPRATKQEQVIEHINQLNFNKGNMNSSRNKSGQLDSQFAKLFHAIK